jgi:hypothetical protein
MTKNVVALCLSHLYSAFCLPVHLLFLDFVTSVFATHLSLASCHFLDVLKTSAIYEEYLFMGCDAV